jgi:hypothetical protein
MKEEEWKIGNSVEISKMEKQINERGIESKKLRRSLILRDIFFRENCFMKI